MANPVLGTPNEGKDFWNANVMPGLGVFWFLLHGKSWADGSILATSTLTSLAAEASGTNYARQSATLGSSLNGIISVPGAVFNTGASGAWQNDIFAAGIASAVSGGVAIDIWDLGGRFGNTTNGSAVVTGLTAVTTDLVAGMKVKGLGIPAGATILSVDSSTQITLSANATATATAAALAFGYDMSPNQSQIVVPTVNAFLKNIFE